MLKMNIKKLPVSMVFILSAFSVDLLAANSFICKGEVTEVGIHSTNNAVLKLTSMNTIVSICSPDQPMGASNPVSAEQCKLAYSTLLTGYAMGNTVKVVFDNVETGTSCENFKTWEVATVSFVSLQRDVN